MTIMKYRIKVIPRASKNEVQVLGKNELKVKLTAPPVDGKANQALIALLADYFQVKRTSIQLISGETSQHKWVKVIQNSSSAV